MKKKRMEEEVLVSNQTKNFNKMLKNDLKSTKTVKNNKFQSINYIRR